MGDGLAYFRRPRPGCVVFPLHGGMQTARHSLAMLLLSLAAWLGRISWPTIRCVRDLSAEIIQAHPAPGPRLAAFAGIQAGVSEECMDCCWKITALVPDYLRAAGFDAGSWRPCAQVVA